MFERIVLVGLLISIVPFGVFGQTPNSPATPAESLKVVQHDLGLSDSQFGRVKELAEERREQLQTIRQQAKPAFEELVRLLRQPDPDPQAVNEAAITFREIHERAVTEQEHSTKEFLSVLNPEQQQTVNGLQSKVPLALALDRLGLLTPEKHENPKVIVQ
jgi:Spy/CpxP family protein refolding chaperone